MLQNLCERSEPVKFKHRSNELFFGYASELSSVVLNLLFMEEMVVALPTKPLYLYLLIVIYFSYLHLVGKP